MKNKFLGAIALLMVGLASAQERKITEKDLPAVVKQNLVKYFGKRNISTIVKDVDIAKTTYEVYFEDYSKAEFKANGDLEDAENPNGLPSVVVPERLREYVKKNYPNILIVKWEKSKNKQEIQLNNGLDLEFDLSGKFLRID